MSDEIETLRKRIAELEMERNAAIDVIKNRLQRTLNLQKQTVKAKADLTEARARLAAADRMAEALELVLKRCGPRATDGEIGRSALQAYRKETGQ